MANHVIELNGQKYDALTGNPVIITASSISSKKVAKKPHNAVKSSGPKHLDGFARRPGVARTSPVATPAKTQKSQTLMRSGVKKPVTNKVHAKAAVAAAPAIAAPAQSGRLFEGIKPGRAIRAGHSTKSNLISKFGPSRPAIKSEILPVAPAPQPLSTHQATSSPHASHTHTKADPFQKAIDNATSHHQPKAKRARVHHRIARRLRVSPRLVSFVGVTLLALGIGSFVAYQNMPEIAMRVAAARAGLRASLPDYQPAGFAMAGPITYHPGEVKLSYQSNTDNRSFEVTQKNSSWNSETLLENFVTPTGQPYQTFQSNGRTVYIYEGNKATWVDGGVWYNIDGKTNLTSDQLLRIANSL